MTNIRYGWKSLRLGRNAVHINKQYNFEMFPLQNVQPTSLEGHDSRLSVQNVYVAVNSGRRRLRPSRRGLYSAQALYIVYLYRGLQYTVYRPRVYYTYTGAWFSQRPTQNSNYRQQNLHSSLDFVSSISNTQNIFRRRRVPFHLVERKTFCKRGRF